MGKIAIRADLRWAQFERSDIPSQRAEANPPGLLCWYEYDRASHPCASYRFKSNRKQKLQRALEELRGIRLNHGVLKSASIEETRDGKDYKMIIKGSGSQVEAVEIQALDLGPDLVVNHYLRPQDSLQVEAEELVRYFQEVFHAVHTHEPQLKETNQALALIAQHGLKESRHIVDFARNEAAKTNFLIQHFSAVLSCASRAVADLNRQHLQPESKKWQPPSTEPEAAPTADWRRGGNRLEVLTAEQYRIRFGGAKAELFRRNPFLARNWKDGNETHEKIVRSRVIRELGSEPMDLMLLSCLPH